MAELTPHRTCSGAGFSKLNSPQFIAGTSLMSMRAAKSIGLLSLIFLAHIIAGDPLPAQQGDSLSEDKPYVVLNKRKLYDGDGFGFLTDCSFYRFTVLEVSTLYQCIRILYPDSLSGNSPDDAGIYSSRTGSFEGVLYPGEVCFPAATCADPQKVCFHLKKNKGYFELSYTLKQGSSSLPIKNPPEFYTLFDAQKKERLQQVEKTDGPRKDDGTDMFSLEDNNWFTF